MTGSELREVRLVAFPLRLHRVATEHHAELMREFQLLAFDDDPRTEVPARLVELIAELNASYAGVAETADAEREAAIARGDESVDLTYRVPPGAAEACERLERMLAEADEFCRSEQLLTLATPAEAAAFRRWYLREFVAQLSGAEPTPWPAAESAAG
ncbi:MAG TPA: hypothetical protein VNA20_14605 [Frankiaceae bacterium]|nr:hypothetical protein [Frankiaceae bacterium]